MHMRYLSGLERQHTCRVGGCLEVGLKMVAGCRQRHAQQKHIDAGEGTVSRSIVQLCVRQGHAHEALTRSRKAAYLSGGGLYGGGLVTGGGLQVKAW